MTQISSLGTLQFHPRYRTHIRTWLRNLTRGSFSTLSHWYCLALNLFSFLTYYYPPMKFSHKYFSRYFIFLDFNFKKTITSPCYDIA